MNVTTETLTYGRQPGLFDIDCNDVFEIRSRIEKAKTLKEVNEIIDDLEQIIKQDVDYKTALEIDKLHGILRKKILTVSV